MSWTHPQSGTPTIILDIAFDPNLLFEKGVAASENCTIFDQQHTLTEIEHRHSPSL
jgi:hypothetical protein